MEEKILKAIQDLSKKFESLDGRLDNLEQGQKSFENKVDDRFNSLENKVDDRFNSLEIKMNDRFNKIEKKVDIIEDHVATLTEIHVTVNQRLTAIDGGKK